MEKDQRRQFVRDHRTCVFGYGRQEHGPAMTVVYYVTDGDDILVSTMAARNKAMAVERDPRVSLCVELMAGQPVDAGRREQIAELAREEQRVVIRVTPYATFATPPRHVRRMEDLDTLTHTTSTSMAW
jgi:hypothetical protein